MKHTIYLLTLIILAAFCRADARDIVLHTLWQGLPNQAHILTVAQVGSEIQYTTIRESFDFAFPHVEYAFYASVIAEIDGPSIVAREVERITVSEKDQDAFRILYANGQKTGTYDSSLGTGWVESQSIGWIWMGNFPWIHSPELGWLYYGGSEVTSPPYPTVHSGDVIPFAPSEVLGFWLWSLKEGKWLFQRNPS